MDNIIYTEPVLQCNATKPKMAVIIAVLCHACIICTTITTYIYMYNTVYYNILLWSVY